jgi:hypothetical protein
MNFTTGVSSPLASMPVSLTSSSPPIASRFSRPFLVLAALVERVGAHQRLVDGLAQALLVDQHRLRR